MLCLRLVKKLVLERNVVLKEKLTCNKLFCINHKVSTGRNIHCKTNQLAKVLTIKYSTSAKRSLQRY